MSTRDWGRWMEARAAHGLCRTWAMVVPGGVVLRVREHGGVNLGDVDPAGSVVFVPIGSPESMTTFLARLGCELPGQGEEQVPPVEPAEPRAVEEPDADVALREAVLHLVAHVLNLEEWAAEGRGKPLSAYAMRLRALRDRIRAAHAPEDPALERPLARAYGQGEKP